MPNRRDETPDADVVVVGSGSAGGVVARRLVDAGVNVLLLEAGLPDDNPAIHDPARLFELWDGEQDWGYRTERQAGCEDRELHWPRGKVLGGSSALNAMIYVHGHRADYDGWAALGNDGWGYDEVLPCSSARRTSIAGATSTTAPAGLFGHLALRAASADRIGRRGGPGGGDSVQRRLQRRRARWGRLLSTRDQGRTTTQRCGGVPAPVLDSPNLTLLTSTRALRARLRRPACVGGRVRARRHRRERRGPSTRSSSAPARSSRHGSLMLSGIGPQEELSPPRASSRSSTCPASARPCTITCSHP